MAASAVTTTVPDLHRVFSFPNPVNEVAARIVAGVVSLVAILTLAAGWHWLTLFLALGFWARVLTGPTLSPLGRAAVALAPILTEPRLVPGPPKRFAQGIGAGLSTLAVIGWTVGVSWLIVVPVAAIVIAAGFESVFAFCLGCQVFALLTKVGVIPESVCEACNDISLLGAGR